jgi:hypothetical protein
MTPAPAQEWILPQKRLDELNLYFNNHKDDLIRIAWKNCRDDIHLHLCHSASSDVLDELRKHFVKLYDDGFKDPLCTFDAAVSMMKYGDIKLRQHKEHP